MGQLSVKQTSRATNFAIARVTWSAADWRSLRERFGKFVGRPARVIDAVKYATNAESCDRRIQSAIDIQGKKMQRRVEFLLTRALRQAGWK